MFGKYFKMEQVKYVLALSCIIPAAIGLFNLKKVEDKYLPFIFMMVLDVIIELISNFTRDHKLVNVYMLVDFSLFLYFVYNNKFLNKNLAKLFWGVAFLFFISNCFYHGIVSMPSYTQLCFVSATMLFVFISVLTKQITALRVKLIDNFWFWLSSAFVLYNANLLLLFSLYNFAMDKTLNGKVIIDNLWPFINTGSYIFFAVAMLKIPPKKRSEKTELAEQNLNGYAV